MGTLIESLLDFSKLSRAELQKTAVDLNRLVAEVRQQFLLEIQDRSIEWRIEPLPVGAGRLESPETGFHQLSVQCHQVHPNPVACPNHHRVPARQLRRSGGLCP